MVRGTLDQPASSGTSPELDAAWQDYAERPMGWRITSTLCAGYSCLDTVIASRVGEWSALSGYRRFEAEIDETARIYEILSPADWHALCVSYPRINCQELSPAGVGTLVPDWGQVARQWDGIHLTFMALLTVPFVRHNSPAGTTMMWSWDTEGTIWIPGKSVLVGQPLGNLDRAVSTHKVTAPLLPGDYVNLC